MNEDKSIEIINCTEEIPEEEKKEDIRIEVIEQTNKPEKGVLEPDHPLLERFQQSLRDHLLRVRGQLIEDISKTNHKIEEREKYRENLGSRLYDLQEEIRRQNAQLESYAVEIKDISEKRILTEETLVPLKQRYEEKLLESKKSKRNHDEHIVELSRLQTLENNIKKWSAEIEEEVNIAKKTVTRDSQFQLIMAEEKKKMDLILFNLDTEVRRREQESNAIKTQISEQKGLINVLHTSFSDAQADLEVLQQEHRRLTQSWGEVIVSIQHRDKVLSQVKSELAQEKEQYRLTCISIEAIQKSCTKEMQKNERLELFKMRLKNDFDHMSNKVTKETAHLAKTEQRHQNLTDLLEQTVKDYNAAKQEGNVLELQLRRIQAQLDKQLERKFKIEEDILRLAQEQMTADKYSEHRMKLLRESQEQRRSLEITLSQTEKVLSTTMLDLEKWKGTILKMKEEMDSTQKVYNETNDQANELSKAIKDIQATCALKVKKIESLSTKLERLMKANQGQEITPTEAKTIELERQIQESETKLYGLKKLWIMLENNMIKISEKRSNQMLEMQLARKRLMISNQKTLKVNVELDKVDSDGNEIVKSIKNLSTKLEILGNKLYKKKKNHEVDEANCELTHNNLIDRLKAAEMSVLEIEEEITDLNKDIESAKELVLEKHREALSWETKYKMIEETLLWRKNEQAMESEIGNMKAEIHRMEIRFMQLKRAQEKLIQDLEHCVMHREQIFTTATVRRKIDGSQSRSRSTIQHKLNEIKNKVKSIQAEISVIEKNVVDVTAQHQHVLNDITVRQDEIEAEKAQNLLIIAEIEQGLLLKHENLESIIRKQHRAKRYRCLACMQQQPKTIKSETVLDMNAQKQKEINENLTDVVQTLLNDNPEKKFAFMKILQTLKEE